MSLQVSENSNTAIELCEIFQLENDSENTRR